MIPDLRRFRKKEKRKEKKRSNKEVKRI